MELEYMDKNGNWQISKGFKNLKGFEKEKLTRLVYLSITHEYYLVETIPEKVHTLFRHKI